MIPTKAYAVHNATGDPLRNNSVPVGPGATASRTARALQLSPNSLVKQYPELNVLINNAGILKVDNVQNAADDALVSSIVTTNLGSLSVGQLSSDTDWNSRVAIWPHPRLICAWLLF